MRKSSVMNAVLLGLARTWCAIGSENILKDFKPENLPFVFFQERSLWLTIMLTLGKLFG